MDNGTEIYSFFERLQQFQQSKYDSKEPFFVTYPFLDCNIQIPINEKKYKSLLLSKQKAIHASQIMQIMNIVVDSYLDYLSDINSKINFGTIEALDKRRNTIARKICNILSSCYAYTEHCSKYLHKIRPSPSFKIYKQQHISSNELKIIEEIRNYAQHAGLPIHNITFEDTQVQILVDIDSLRDSKKSNTGILNKFPENSIELSNLLPLYIRALYEMHCEIAEDLPRTMSKLYGNMNSIISEMSKESQNPKLKDVILIRKLESKIEKHTISSQFQSRYDYFNQLNQDAFEQAFNGSFL